MKDLLDYLVRSIADEPDQVEVTEIRRERMTVLELRVGEEDLGKVIGRQGRTARALRVVLTATGAKIGERVVLDIVE